MKLSLLMTAAALTLFSGYAMAADPVTHTEVSTSADGTKTTTTTRYYYGNDANNNGILDSAEFPAYVYHRWDRNGDGFLTDDEWQTSATRWYGPARTEYKTYKAWDKNGDGRIDPTEFDVIVTDSKLYSTWDSNADSIIQQDEYATATFALYDLDGDGVLSVEEWRNAQ